MLIEDYALIGDSYTAALVGRNGSIDWLCVPRFDSDACFAALLGTPAHGRFRIAPRDEAGRVTRRYRGDSLVLETETRSAGGVVRVVDFMPLRVGRPVVVRVVEGVAGRVPMRFELAVRFDYGEVTPWVRVIGDRLHVVSGPDALCRESPVRFRIEGHDVGANFEVTAGQSLPFVLAWYRSHERPPARLDAVVRSTITLKAMTYAPTGGIVAAATTSLPETLGGTRNWDYRYVWLRDATFMLLALLQGGYREEAVAWRDWLLRAMAGDPEKLQVMYGLAGERHISERTLSWLPGYEGSRPVRVGNGAVGQLQLDVYGEVIDALYQSRRAGITSDPATWELERAIIEWLESSWARPDHGLWEVRGKRRMFTHSKVMAWVAMDRAVKSVAQHGVSGDVARWSALRDTIHRDVCAHGYNPRLGSFTQSYGSDELDASLLLIPSVGFLPVTDARVQGTIRAIERELLCGGFVRRYQTDARGDADGIPGVDNAFLACSFWMVDAYALSGRVDKARALFERLLSVRNDVGLLAEEYDPVRGRLVGNFPQVFSHVALVNSARNLAHAIGPARTREGATNATARAAHGGAR